MTTLLGPTSFPTEVFKYGNKLEGISETNLPLEQQIDVRSLPSEDDPLPQTWGQLGNDLGNEYNSYFLIQLPLDYPATVGSIAEKENFSDIEVVTSYTRPPFPLDPKHTHIYAYDSPARPFTDGFSALYDFAKGVEESEPPSSEVVDVASAITNAAYSKTIDPEISVDIDGALSFDLRLLNGLLLVAELDVDGTLEALLIDDNRDVVVKRFPNVEPSNLLEQF